MVNLDAMILGCYAWKLCCVVGSGLVVNDADDKLMLLPVVFGDPSPPGEPRPVFFICSSFHVDDTSSQKTYISSGTRG